MSAPPAAPAAPAAAQRNRGYTRWKGERSARGLRWWVIARGNLSLALSSRWIKTVLILSMIPGVVLAGLTYFFVPLSAVALDEGLSASLVFAFLIGGVMGARMVSEDRRQGAFLAHFARPVTRMDYVLGKLVALAIPLLFVTAVPSLLAIATDASIDSENVAERLQRETGNAGDAFDTAGYLRQANYVDVVVAVLSWSLVASVATAGIVLGLSALATRARLAGVAWFAVVAFGWIAHLVLQQATDADWPALLSWWDNLSDLSSRLLGVQPDPRLDIELEFHGAVRALVVMGAALVGLAIVHEQLRRAEGGVRG